MQSQPLPEGDVIDKAIALVNQFIKKLGLKYSPEVQEACNWFAEELETIIEDEFDGDYVSEDDECVMFNSSTIAFEEHEEQPTANKQAAEKETNTQYIPSKFPQTPIPAISLTQRSFSYL